MHIRFIAALALGLQLPCWHAAAAELPAAAKTFEQLQSEALDAYKGKNYAQMETLLKQSEQLRPNHPRALYNLAAAKALRGDADGALALLEKLDRMKLGYRIWEDGDFTTLKGNARFEQLTESFKRHLQPQGSAAFGFSAGVSDFMPEGIAYDRDNNAYYLGSVHQRRVLMINRDSQHLSLVTSADYGLYSALGMKVEPPTHRLWVASAALPEMEGYDAEDRGRSGLFAFDTRSGRLRGKYLLPKDGKEHVLGDLIISSKGRVFTTDSAEGVLYELDRGSGKYTALTAPGELISPQGLTFAPKQGFIYLADYARGLLRYDLDRKLLQPLPGRDDICLYGIDGLYYYKGSLVAIQNGVRPNRVVRIELDESADPPKVTGMQVLVANHSDFDEPTLGVLKNSGVFYFIANSHWNRVNERHRLPPEDLLTRPVVLRIDLERKIQPADSAGNRKDQSKDQSKD